MTARTLKDSCDFVTVVTMDVPTGKFYTVVDGAVTKTPAANNAAGYAATWHVPTTQSLADLIKHISTQTHCALILGYVAGTEPTVEEYCGKSYRLLSSSKFDEMKAQYKIKGDKFNSKPFEIDGLLYATRTKRMFSPSTWFGFDRDVVEGMPDELEPNAGFGRWLEMLNEMIPEINGCSYVAVKSASCRINFNGKPLADTNVHVYMQAREAKDTERFGKAGMVHAFARGYGFMRPVKDRNTGAVIGQRPWTLYDPTTFSRERLFFDGSPILDPLNPAVVIGQLFIDPSEPVIYNGVNDRVNTRSLPLPNRDEQRSWGLEIEVDKKGRVTIVNTSDLTPEIEFEYHNRQTGERGTMTMLEFVEGDIDRLSCQSVFRPDSSSFAAYVSKEDGCHPFMYDVGTNINYKYNNVKLEFARALSSDATIVPTINRGVYNGHNSDVVASGNDYSGDVNSDVHTGVALESGTSIGRVDNGITTTSDPSAPLGTARGDIGFSEWISNTGGGSGSIGDNSKSTVPDHYSQTSEITLPPPPAQNNIDLPNHLANDVTSPANVKISPSENGGLKPGFSIAESFSIGDTLDSVAPEFGETDLGNANRFANMFSETLRWVPIYKSWFRWVNSRWEKCEGVDARSAAHIMAGVMSKYANTLPDDASFRKWAISSCSSTSIGATVREAMQIEKMVVRSDQIDTNWYNFGVANGYIDLRLKEDGSGRIRGFSEPDPSIFMTKGSDVQYSKSATCPVWEKTLFDIFSGDTELIKFFQIFSGYSMMGKPVHEVLAFLVGGGSNGKSTVTGVLEKIFGDYKATVDKRALMRSRDSDGQAATPAIARLKGVRLAIVTETQEGDVIDESVIKSLSGSDTITARHLHGDVFDFDATFVSWIATNHPPNIRSTDDGTWRRVMQFPFKRNFEKELGKKNLDTGLKQRLIQTELAGILNWCLRGVELYERDGLIPPASVVEATETYRDEQDILANWMSECLEIGASFEVSNQQLWNSYDKFSTANGDKIIHSSRTLNSKISAKGFKRLLHLSQDNTKRGFQGLRIKFSPIEN